MNVSETTYKSLANDNELRDSQWPEACVLRTDESRAVGFFVRNTGQYFSNFMTADFHDIWLSHTNPCPLENYGN